jgi:hypothetical protein
VKLKLTLPVAVVMLSDCDPVGAPLGTLMVAEMVEPSGVTFVIAPVMPDGPVMPVAPRKFRPVMVTEVAAFRFPLFGETAPNTGETVMFAVAPKAMPVELAWAMSCVVPEPMVAAVDTVPALLAAFAPVCAYVNVVPVPTPVIVNTPLKDVSVTPEIPTIFPTANVEAVLVVTVTTLLDLEIALIV